ncbi:MAG: ribosome maturation factor RimM [Actinomycetota bacterium]|nr:ribosome maturation factor RimM [Actinomycetota bacterium]
MAEKTLEVGYVVKAHGLKGEVIVALTTNRSERVEPGSTLRCSGKDLKIISSSAHQGRWIVRFEGVDDRNQAEALRGMVMSASPILDENEIWVDEIVGLPVFDQAGNKLGVVDALQANPASDLLVLDSGVLIPLVFVVEGELAYRRCGAIHVSIPDGLLESEL